MWVCCGEMCAGVRVMRGVRVGLGTEQTEDCRRIGRARGG